MRRFKWNDWNRAKIAAHSLSTAEVEASFGRILSVQTRRDGSFKIQAATPAGRPIYVIWRYDREPDEVPDTFGDVPEPATFVITAY